MTFSLNLFSPSPDHHHGDDDDADDSLRPDRPASDAHSHLLLRRRATLSHAPFSLPKHLSSRRQQDSSSRAVFFLSVRVCVRVSLSSSSRAPFHVSPILKCLKHDSLPESRSPAREAGAILPSPKQQQR